jgi:aspartyl-tRNA(Asn)/glutamyl-tRNA(Gln) amidotransferase subunit C
MSTISTSDVQKLASLSALTLTDQETELMQQEIAEILTYVEQLEEIDTDSVAPTYQVHDLETVVRADTVIDYGVTKESLLKNASAQKDGSIVVPRVIE